MSQLHRLGNSLRTRSLEQTLAIAERAADELGITRCVEVTRMDRVGVPVFSATRPRAPIVCVTAGKGLVSGEARVGALMEAIEQQVAWEERTRAEPMWLTPAKACSLGAPRLEDMAPNLGASLAPDRKLAWLPCHRLDDAKVWVPIPAEVLLTPCPPELNSGTFASSTTGLASGNDFDDAVLHGLCEVLERDISAFEALWPSSRLVRAESLRGSLAEAHGRLNSEGLRAWMRWLPSPSGVNYFCTLVTDDDQPSPMFCNGGFGSHPNAEIAAARSLTEAAQSRVSFIQGAREDLADTYSYFARKSSHEQRAHREALIDRYSAASGAVEFDQIPSSDVMSPRTHTDQILARLKGSELGSPVSYAYRCSPADLSVVRVVVPGAEQLRNANRRVGARLIRRAREDFPKV